MLAYLIMKTSRNLKCKLDRELKVFGITSSQFSVMNQIENESNKTVAYEIADKLGYDRPTVSAIIQRLYKSNMIIKIENPSDRRTQYLSLTKNGLNTLYQLREVADNISNDLFGDMSEENKELLANRLNSINLKLEEKNE